MDPLRMGTDQYSCAHTFIFCHPGRTLINLIGLSAKYAAHLHTGEICVCMTLAATADPFLQTRDNI